LLTQTLFLSCRWIVCLWLALPAAACSTCGETPVADAGADAGADAAELLDARPDVTPLPDAQHADRELPPYPDAALPWDSGPAVDAVAGSVVELPPSPQNMSVGPWHQNQHVVYSEERGVDMDVYLYDLNTRSEITVVAETGRQGSAYICDGSLKLIWSDGRWYDPPTSEQYEVFSYDIQSQAVDQVTNHGEFSAATRCNSTHLLYATRYGVPAQESGFNLVLMEWGSGQTRVLADYGTWWEGADISETHVSWVAHAPSEGGYTKSVYLHEIASGVTRLLTSTVTGRQFNTSTAGDWVVWQDNRNGNWDIFGYRISTGQEQALVTEPHDQITPNVHDELVVWLDSRWSGQPLGSMFTPSDLVIYDLQTGHWRRATGWSDWWGMGRAQGGWMTYRHCEPGDPSLARVLAMDLVANLILDPNGRVIPVP
jgi:beta propeller repeat protein